MRITDRSLWIHLLLLLMVYAIAIVYQGYQYGQGDQSQILPVLYEQDHPGTYPADHYVKAYLDSGVNERTVFHFLLRHMGYQSPWIVFLWHALFSMLLIGGWVSITSFYIKNKVLQWLPIVLILTLGFHFSTGANEIYYPQLVPSLCAKALATWAIYWWIKEKYSLWVILLVVSAYLQPLVSIQLFIVMAVSLMIKSFTEKKWAGFPWLPIVMYSLATIPWIILLAINNGGHANPVLFMQILEFRLPHHFFATAFNPVHISLFVCFTVTCILKYKDRIRWMIVLIAAGCFIYEIGAEVLRLPMFLYTQWWKSTLWIEAFAFIAIISLIDQKAFFRSRRLEHPAVVIGIFLFVVCVYRFSGIRDKPDYKLPFATLKNDEIDISEQAKQLTGEASLFIIPPDLSEFRWYARRSNYIDYKAMLHTEEFLYEWYKRIEKIYGYNFAVKESGTNIYDQAHSVLSSPSYEKLDQWKTLGITHFISSNTSIPQLKPIAVNETYAIYEIPGIGNTD